MNPQTQPSEEEIKQIEEMVDKSTLSPELKEAMKRTFIQYDEALRVLGQ
jgi:hypothetical protein